MQHAGRDDQIELPAERIKIEDIAVQILDIGHAKLGGLAAGIGEAGAAEVDGGDLRPGKAARDFDGLLPGAAPGNEDLGGRGLSGRGGRERQIELRDHLADAQSGLTEAGTYPARIGVVLILVANLVRDMIGNPSKACNPRPQFGLAGGFGDLHPPGRPGQGGG